nr:MAG TPA: hypothetical protein [Caudoviricetes sp.]
MAFSKNKTRRISLLVLLMIIISTNSIHPLINLVF